MVGHSGEQEQMEGEPPLGSPRDLERRLRLVPPEDAVRGYFFESTLEQVQRTGDAQAVRRCLEVSGVAAPAAFFKYPLSCLLPMLYHAAWALRGTGSFEASLHGLGRQVCQRFLENPVGRSLLMMSMKSPKLLAASLPVGYRTGWDHGRVTLRWAGPNHCIASIHGGLVPFPYIEGILQHLFEATGAVHERVTGRQLEISETEYVLRWA